MSNRVEKVFLKLTSAIAVDGIILKAGHIIELAENEAKSLLSRGKAELATASDHPQAAPVVDELPPAPLVAPAPDADKADEAPASSDKPAESDATTAVAQTTSRRGGAN